MVQYDYNKSYVGDIKNIMFLVDKDTYSIKKHKSSLRMYDAKTLNILALSRQKLSQKGRKEFSLNKSKAMQKLI